MLKGLLWETGYSLSLIHLWNTFLRSFILLEDLEIEKIEDFNSRSNWEYEHVTRQQEIRWDEPKWFLTFCWDSGAFNHERWEMNLDDSTASKLLSENDFRIHSLSCCKLWNICLNFASVWPRKFNYYLWSRKLYYYTFFNSTDAVINILLYLMYKKIFKDILWKNMM